MYKQTQTKHILPCHCIHIFPTELQGGVPRAVLKDKCPSASALSDGACHISSILSQNNQQEQQQPEQAARTAKSSSKNSQSSSQSSSRAAVFERKCDGFASVVLQTTMTSTLCNIAALFRIVFEGKENGLNCKRKIQHVIYLP